MHEMCTGELSQGISMIHPQKTLKIELYLDSESFEYHQSSLKLVEASNMYVPHCSITS